MYLFLYIRIYHTAHTSHIIHLYISISKQKRKEEVKKKHIHSNTLMLDLREMTKCYYDVLKRNKELYEETTNNFFNLFTKAEFTK